MPNETTAQPRFARRLLRASQWAVFVLLLAGCNLPQASSTTPTTASSPGTTAATVVTAATGAPPAATASAAPTTPPITPTLPPTQPPLATLTAELSATIIAELPPTPTPEQADGISFSGIEGVKLLPLAASSADRPLWAMFTYGLRGFSDQQMQNHRVAIYTRNAGSWQELGRIELESIDNLGEDSVKEVKLAPGRTWLEVQGVAGAHSGVYALLSFDGTTLRNEIEGFNSSPAAGELKDLDGDGTPEVVLNATDNYVFCYACGVRLLQFQVLRWDGTALSEQKLAPLPDSAPSGLRDANNLAVKLAQSELWKDAQAAISQTVTLDAQNPTVKTNAMLIGLHAEARAEQARNGPYPLLDNVFYGDYAAALDTLRPLSVAEIFNPSSSVISGTVAEGFEKELSQYMNKVTTQALQAKPDLAAAYFLRGWGLAISEPNNPQVLSDLEQAAKIDPQERLFTESLAHLRKP